jgi:hypothetical protein
MSERAAPNGVLSVLRTEMRWNYLPDSGATGRTVSRARFTANRGYNSDTHPQRLRDRGIMPMIARRRTDEHDSGLGTFAAW